MIGRKIYYELTTGDVVLITEEKQGLNAVNTTREQDFQMYSPLQVRSPETIGMIQLEYGQHAAEFMSARSVKVDIDTEELLFEYPAYHPPLTIQVENLKAENQALKAENDNLKHTAEAQSDAIAELSLMLSMLMMGGE